MSSGPPLAHLVLAGFGMRGVAATEHWRSISRSAAVSPILPIRAATSMSGSIFRQTKRASAGSLRTFPVYSSAESDFNFDYHVSFTAEQMEAGKAEYNYRVDPIGMSEAPGVSVFVANEGKIFHTYSAYARGLDLLNVAYNYLDIVPKGRDEGAGNMTWLHRRDEYPD